MSKILKKKKKNYQICKIQKYRLYIEEFEDTKGVIRNRNKNIKYPYIRFKNEHVISLDSLKSITTNIV